MGLSMRLSWVSLLWGRPEGGNLSDTQHSEGPPPLSSHWLWEDKMHGGRRELSGSRGQEQVWVGSRDQPSGRERLGVVGRMMRSGVRAAHLVICWMQCAR